MSKNVHTVATAVEEMTASIREIARMKPFSKQAIADKLVLFGIQLPQSEHA